MSEKEKKLITICEAIWEKRAKPNIWLDREAEAIDPSFLVYKRLDGLRAILTPFARGVLRPSDLPLISQKDFIKEIATLADFLTKSKHFYPAPHTQTLDPQPDDYIDMAAHSLLFGIYALNLKLASNTRASVFNLIDKCVKCLTDENNYYHDTRLAAWAGTTKYQEERNIKFLGVYFSAQAIGAISEWLTFVSKQVGVSKDIKNNTAELIKKGCRWMLSQTNKTYDILSPENKEATVNELITTNTAALTICLQQWELLNTTEQNLTRKIATNFINYLKTNKPEDTQWHRLVPTQQVGPQFYYDRQDNYGIVTFLASAKEKVGDASISAIEELAGYFIREYLHVKVDDLLIGCLPWYIQDHIASLNIFSELHSELTFSGNTLRKAIFVALNDTGLIENVTRSVLRNLVDIEKKLEIEKTEEKLRRSKEMKK